MKTTDDTKDTPLTAKATTAGVTAATGFEFDSNNFKTVDRFIVDAAGTINASASELDFDQHKFEVTSDLKAGKVVFAVTGYEKENLAKMSKDKLEVNVETSASKRANLDIANLDTIDTLVLKGAADTSADSAAKLGDKLTITGQELVVNAYVFDLHLKLQMLSYYRRRLQPSLVVLGILKDKLFSY